MCYPLTAKIQSEGYACCFECRSKKKMYHSEDSRFYCEDCFKKSGINLYPPCCRYDSSEENIECEKELFQELMNYFKNQNKNKKEDNFE